MKILMLAPEPCFEPRGTPFSVFHRCTALGKMGYEVDLVTYHLGEEREIYNVKIHRIPKLPLVKHVKIGPSLVKIPLDFLVFVKAFVLLLNNKYDCIHAHEEAAVMGCFARKLFKIPFVYDMHSSIPQQLLNFNFTHNKYAVNIAQLIESWIIHQSDAVIAICPHLAQTVQSIEAGKYVRVIENTPLTGEESSVTKDQIEQLRHHLSLQSAPIVIYTGTMEHYQGLDLLLESIPRVLDKNPEAIFVLVGGEDDQINTLKEHARLLSVDKHVIFTGKRPSDEMSLFMELADVLVSPRNTGTNTPLKIYSYLKSGKPIVATNLLTHTQVLDQTVAVLTDPDPQSFAEGIIQVLSDNQLAVTIGMNARNLADTAYSYSAFFAKTKELYDYIETIQRDR